MREPCFRRCSPTMDPKQCAEESGLNITVCLCECHDEDPINWEHASAIQRMSKGSPQECVCGHTRLAHPFGLSEAMTFYGRCECCGCLEFQPMTDPVPVRSVRSHGWMREFCAQLDRYLTRGETRAASMLFRNIPPDVNDKQPAPSVAETLREMAKVQDELISMCVRWAADPAAADAADWRTSAVKHQLDKEALEAGARALEEREELSRWKDELTDIGVVNWVLSAENKNDPRRLIADIVQQNVKEALDPAVSKEAAALVARAVRAAFAGLSEGSYQSDWKRAYEQLLATLDTTSSGIDIQPPDVVK